MSSQNTEARKEIIIDAEGAILGRLASKIAQLLKEGYDVYVVNAEKAVVSGEKRRVIEGYKIWLSLRTLRNPEKSSPKRPRNPISIVKYTVRGMLPKSFNKGRARLSKLKVFVGVPKELESKEMIRLVTRRSRKVVTVAEIATALGWRGKK
ncbi:MAG: 50S ribosomal protein L13 [Desulfurococcaceae archaeon TW002]